MTTSGTHIDAISGQGDRLSTDNFDIVLFDGVCNLCNRWIRFVINRDPSERFRFAPLQSETGLSLIANRTIPGGLDTIVLYEGGELFTRSTAVLRIARHLRPPWPVLSLFLFVPRVIRDGLYTVIANNRYKWFGRQPQCMIPSPDLMTRFLM